MSSTSKKFAALGAAAITTTALTVAVVPDSNAHKSREELLRLLADIRPFGTDPQAIPDLTGGLGSAGYDLSQDVADQLIRLVVANFSLAALADAAGFSPEDLVESLIGDGLGPLLTPVLGSALGGIPLPVGSVLGPVLAQALAPVLGGLSPAVAGVLTTLLGDDLTASTLAGVFNQLGLNLSNPLDLSGDPVPGVNIATTGLLFTLLKLLGFDIGWVPPLPNSVADDINDSDYLTVGLRDVLDTADVPALNALLIALNAGKTIDDLPDLASIRLIPVVGTGMGAFAAGAAYQQVVDDLENQPGGENGAASLLGSYTVLPMILLLNPGRANGGPLARAFPLFRLLGIDTVTPETEVQSNGGYLPIGNTGLTVGGANLIPIKLDVGIQNFPLSDFAAWPNPVTLANNAAALMFPTYIIRGFDATNVSTSLAQQIVRQLPNTLPNGEHGLALNFYLTVPIGGAPVLEPTYLFVDAINLLTGANLNNPIGTALNPFLTSAGNLGYTDTVRNADGEYVRTFDDTEVPTAFFSFPDVDWTKVPGDLTNSLQVGIAQAIDDGLINTGPPAVNALRP